MAPFMVIGDWFSRKAHLPALHLQTESEDCLDCGRCANACPMSLDVPALAQSGSMQHSECILCGACVDNCSQGVIRFAWRRKNAA
jgi:NAD-dependent dihydropyrimidine dehydrogenase PreA subunit